MRDRQGVTSSLNRISSSMPSSRPLSFRTPPSLLLLLHLHVLHYLVTVGTKNGVAAAVITPKETTLHIIKPTGDDDFFFPNNTGTVTGTATATVAPSSTTQDDENNVDYWGIITDENNNEQQDELTTLQPTMVTDVTQSDDFFTASLNFDNNDNDDDTGILTTLRLFDNLRRDLPHDFERATAHVGASEDDSTDSNVDLFTLPNGDQVAFCHISTVIPFTYGDKIPRVVHHEDAAVIMLAVHHLNSGNGTIVPEVEGLDKRCNIRFTSKMADTEFQGGVALSHVVEQTSRETRRGERIPCGFLGAYRSAVSIPMSIVTGLLGYPQISGASTSASLDDKSQYPLFGRTIPTDAGNANPIIVYLRDVFQIKHLAVINVNDAYGNAYVEGLRAARDVHAPDMLIHQIPLDTDVGSNNLEASTKTAVASLKATGYRFIFMVVFTPEVHDAVMLEAYAQGCAGDGFHTWLFGDSFLGILEGRSFEKNSPLHLSYRGSGLFEVTGGVTGMPKYDHFVATVAELHNPTDLEYIGATFPQHPEPEYGYPPYVKDDPTFLKEITSSFAPFFYEAAIALGLAACHAADTVGTLNFTGREHFDAFLETNFSGFSGAVLINNATGTRDPESALYKVTNYVEVVDVDTTSTGAAEMVRFVPINTNLFQAGEWVQTQEYIFNDGTTVLPSDLPPAPVEGGSGINVAVVVVVPIVVIAVLAVVVFLFYENKRKKNDSVWAVDKEELKFDDPPVIIGRGSFGLVLLAEYRGTQVAVKRVIPPKSNKKGRRRKGTASATASEDEDEDESQSAHVNGVDDLEYGMASGTGLQGKSSTGSDTSGCGPKNSSGGNSDGMASGIGGGTGESSSWGANSLNLSGVTSMIRKDPRSSQANVPTSKASQWRKMKKEFMEEMRYLSKLRHPCITTVMGAVTKGEPMLIMEYMDHGSLYDLLHNETIAIEGELILPLLRDITQGVRFLHSSDPQIIHGDLKAANILVDSRFRAKVADFGLSKKQNLGGTGTPFWMAPELLRFESCNTTATDVYSYGIILYEVFSRRDPYEGEDARDVLRLVADKKVKKRPPAPRHMPDAVAALMRDSLEEDPEKRPTCEEIEIRLKRIDAESLDTNQTKGKGSLSLFDIFPRHIAEALRDGRTPEAEHKDVVTIFFCDIVGFTTISSTLEPRKVATMLDRLYTKFDALSQQHDIFKVETIGDAYMAVTNLVKDQKDDHAKRIAEFAIDAIKAANETYIDEDDHSKGCVNIRVGFHSGPVVADVVGTRNPRYCLFGDTVNTASRMESNSEKNRIHCSRRAAAYLHQHAPQMQMKSRGKIQIKGKGEMHTYWVNEASDRRMSKDISLKRFADAVLAEQHGGRRATIIMEPLHEHSSEFTMEFASEAMAIAMEAPEVAPEPSPF